VFNEYQQEAMRDLAAMRPEDKCWCAWYPKGKCATPSPCPPDKSLADRLVVECPGCHNYPDPELTRPIIHRKGCSCPTFQPVKEQP